MAPSGVLMVGLALVFRDLVQRRLGRAWAVAAIITGALLSALLAPAALVLASAAAFLLSETADFAVYTPLQEKRLVLAVVFGSLEFLSGQVIGKSWMIVLTLPFIVWLRNSDARRGIQPA